MIMRPQYEDAVRMAPRFRALPVEPPPGADSVPLDLGSGVAPLAPSAPMVNPSPFSSPRDGYLVRPSVPLAQQGAALPLIDPNLPGSVVDGPRVVGADAPLVYQPPAPGAGPTASAAAPVSFLVKLFRFMFPRRAA